MNSVNIGLASIVLGASLVTMAAAYGISRIASTAVESIARQPEAGKNIQTTMVIAAGLIEGIAFICAIICLIALFQ